MCRVRKETFNKDACPLCKAEIETEKMLYSW